MVQPSGSCSSCEVFTVSQIKRQGLPQAHWYRCYYFLQEAGLYLKSLISCLKLFPLVIDRGVMKKERENWRACQFARENFMLLFFVSLSVRFFLFPFFVPPPVPPPPPPTFNNLRLINSGPILYIKIPFCNCFRWRNLICTACPWSLFLLSFAFIYTFCVIYAKMNIFENKVVQPRKKGVMLHFYLHTTAIALQATFPSPQGSRCGEVRL